MVCVCVITLCLVNFKMADMEEVHIYSGPSLSKLFFFKFYTFKINLHLTTGLNCIVLIFKCEFNIKLEFKFNLKFHFEMHFQSKVNFYFQFEMQHQFF